MRFIVQRANDKMIPVVVQSAQYWGKYRVQLSYLVTYFCDSFYPCYQIMQTQKRTFADLSIHVKRSCMRTIEMLRSYFDNCLFAETRQLGSVMEQTEWGWEPKPTVWNNYLSLGVVTVWRLDIGGTPSIQIKKSHHMKRLTVILANY